MKIGVGLFTGQIPKGSGRTYHQEYRDAIELVQLAETEGFDGAWVSEHHFAEDGYLPSLLPLLAAFATVTERIELGTGVVLAPFHDPIRLAEDFAVVDQISNGRLICGLGIGWRDEEFREFNINVKTRTRRLEEITEILRLAWGPDRFDFQGRHYRYEGVSVTPKPARVPPILIGGFVDDAVRRAGRIGDGYISSRANRERVAESFAMAAEERKKARRDGPPIVGVLMNAYATTDPERDWPMVRDGIGHQLGVYTGWRSGTDAPGTPLEVMPPDEDTIRKTTAYGTPQEVVEFLDPLIETLTAYPESHLVVRLHYPGMDKAPAAEAIELFGRDVAPRLRDKAARP
ncbi:MAG: LLM class flavin-dependent oxidoreductase [Actinomycetota bacterium]|nr:LLM class flavin-dependent oxidoreductase [Actinomycetota bacterium]